jgi:hypothetical protein
MKKVIVIIFLFCMAGLKAQTKKEQLQILKSKVDSLNIILGSERHSMSVYLNENQKLNRDHNTLIESKNDIIKSLQLELSQCNHESDSVKLSLTKRISLLNDSLTHFVIKKKQNFNLQYLHNKIFLPNDNKIFTTVFLNFKNKDYIVADSIISMINENEFCFYFLTPLEKEINLQCPNEYEIIVLNDNNNEVYSTFSSDKYKSLLKGNCQPKLYQYKAKYGIRDILCLGSSACGSDLTIFYYEVKIINQKIEFKELFSASGGYTNFHFIPEKDTYFKIERINPDCHFGCPSKYTISTYSLSSDLLLKKSATKFVYEDYNEIGIEVLLKKIQVKEPSVFQNGY